jgi:dipeptidyl aminopeptidase/acylaminoacyl peptidase
MMRKVFFFPLGALLALSLSYCVRGDEASDRSSRTVKQYSIEQFMNNTAFSGSSFSHDETRILVSSNLSGIYNAYQIPVQGGEPEALTQSTGSSIFAVSFFPEDDRILFSMDDNGNEIYHLFARDTDGNVHDLTPAQGARAVFYGWAHDKRSFFYGYNQRDPRLMDVYEMDIATFQPQMIFQNDGAYDFAGISNDKRYMALSKSINTNDADLYLYRFADSQLVKISESQAGHQAADFSADSRHLYYLTDDGAEYKYLMRYELANGDREKVMSAEWDIWYAYFSREGKYQVVGINEDGKTAVRVWNTETGEQVSFPRFEQGDITSVNISDNERLMTFYVGSSSSPSNLHVFHFDSGEHRQLTNALNPEIDPDDLATAEVIRYPSFDGLEIPAIYYRPHQASRRNPTPALVWVHGGPGGQSRQTYNPLLQYLVNHGYAVLAVNNRGSSGYGKTFYRMDDQNHGEGDLQDCVWAKKWLESRPYINSEQIGIIGGSYGGFMVMRALTAEPEAFAVGVNIFGVTNWIRTLRSIPPWWESFKDALYQEMGDPYSADSLRLHDISPLFHADKIVRPLMVLQGAQDPRVLKIESDEIVEAARANEVPVEYVLFEDEGHGFIKKENQIEANSRILRFLERHLRGAGNLKD